MGSGIGVLGVAGLLAKLAHKRVLVQERHYAVGGFTHTFKRPGYEWDVGVHVPGARGHVAWAELGHTPARFGLRSLGPRTPIDHLYLTGADVGLCRLMGALSGAALCASAVLRRNVFGELSRERA
ncbi:MAG: NAD(P)-binding protein [Vicinamibacterales bacterium]